MTPAQKEILSSWLDQGKTPLEFAEAFDVPFHEVRMYCDRMDLEPRKFFIAVGVTKARRSDEYWPQCP